VGQVAVVVREDEPGRRQLVAYVVPAAGVVGAGVVDGVDVRRFAAGVLPEHMVPSAVVVVPELPLTVNGKLDRAALPAPDYEAMAGGGEPRTPVERLLCELFAEVLGVGRVGVDDGFFDLGGDSIMSMQLVARARADGIVITPRQVFELKTPAGLATVATADVTRPADSTRDTPTGQTPLVPVMHWVAARGGLRRFSQTVLTTVPAELAERHFVAAFQALAEHHDMLRARLVCPDEHDTASWRLDIPTDPPRADLVLSVAAADLTDDELDRRIAAESDAAADRLDPGAGVMIQAVWLDRGPLVPGRLLIVAHHLVVDGVSWRVLLPDLAAACDAALAGEPAVLEPVRTSFRRWARLAAEQATDPARVAELPFWRAALTGAEPPLGDRPLDPARDTVTTVRRVSVTVSREDTADLLTTVPAIFNAGMDVVLLAGLAAAMAERRPGALLVDVEGHGREPLADDMDLSRTVGWFTDVHPVRLDHGTDDLTGVRTGGEAASVLIKNVKEQVRAVPGDGLGFGLLRYLNPATGPELAGLATPQVGFNYLGRFAAGSGTAPWRPDRMGGEFDARMPVAHALEADGVVEDGPEGPQLTVSLSWPGDVFEEEAVRGLAEGWAAMLHGLARHAASPGAGGHTPSDFPLLDLAQHQLEELESEIAMED
jgi:non-ribosomal peptide synthase protein (TIGR01720 family)